MLAKRFSHSTSLLLIHRFREQARPHTGARFQPGLRVLLFCYVATFLQAQVSQCFCGNFGWQRDVTVFHHNFLTLFGQNQFHELGFQRG